MEHQESSHASSQAHKAGNGGIVPPVSKRFGQPGGNPINRAGTPKYVREIRAELKNMLDPNLTIEDYQKMANDAKTDSGLRGVFASAILKRDYKVVVSLIDQAYGRPAQAIDVTTDGEKLQAGAIIGYVLPSLTDEPSREN